MGEMTFKYTIQQYQTDAVDSVVGVFANQNPHTDRTAYRMDPDIESLDLYGNQGLGYANEEINISNDDLLNNIQNIQKKNNLFQSERLITRTLSKGKLGACILDVEMETGTGKTYVYIKTMFELNKRYGWTKFIVVVPSIAIREGVKKSFETTEGHFMELYGKKINYFIYDSKKLDDIRTFSTSASLQCMIINMQAFNSSFNEEKSGKVKGKRADKAARIIYSTPDSFGSYRPIDAIAANRPIIIMDEPQKMGGEKTQKALEQFHPLFCVNYSATHKDHHNSVYVLDALDAYNEKLVKKIEVKGFELKNLRGTDGYMFLEEIVLSPKEPPKARLEIEIKYNKSINRETRIVRFDDDLFALSNGLAQYKGYHINEINPFTNTVSFTNGKEIQVGEGTGDVSEKDLRRVQIRETIRSHIQKEKELYDKGIKVLSLFFIDEVAKYRKYDEDGNEVNAEYGKMFEQEYGNILNEEIDLFDENTSYGRYLKKINVHDTHTGYFSIDPKGHKIDSTGGSNNDISTYDLIMKDKEKLLSFDNPVRFIFSHSALREGWDNPNVFQICTLKHGGDSPTLKRQEVGRGLRLCVNQDGDRMDYKTLGERVQDINKLTVIASEGYSEYVSGLQEGIKADLHDRPTKITEKSFLYPTLVSEDGSNIKVSEKQAAAAYNYLVKNDYVDNDHHVTDKYRQDAANGTLPDLPEICQGLKKEIHAIVQSVYNPKALEGMLSDGHKPKIMENKLNDNFYKKEFQELWKQINHKYAYTVEFDSDELIRKAIASIDEKLFVTELKYTITWGEQGKDWDVEKLKAKAGFNEPHSETKKVLHTDVSHVKYDLVGEIAKGAMLTRKTAIEILKGIKPEKFYMFKNNPEEFIAKVSKLIKEEKAQMIVDHVSYNMTDGTYDNDIFTAEKNVDYTRAYEGKKSIQDYVFTDGYARDGQSVERKFAQDMDLASEVSVYAKLPKGFAIPTPVGNYSPDWAIAFRAGTVKHIFFIAETKGTMDSLNLRPIEKTKISCAKKLFNSISTEDVVYHEVDSFQNLMNIINEL